MNASTVDLHTEKLRQNILDAASERFLTYGFGKTTMAEIAEDVSMSAANLYRYFQSKQDIAAACAEQCMSSHYEHLRVVTCQKHLTASQRLHTFAIEAYRHNADSAINTPKINELVNIVSHSNPELVQKKIQAQIALIAEILAYGNETSEFSVDDIITKADTIYFSLLLFDVPIFISLFSPEEFEIKAKNIVNTLIDGIRKRE